MPGKTFQVLFDQFGGKQGGFTGLEKTLIKKAVQDAYEFSNLAYQSAGNGFMDKREKVTDWFGGSGPAKLKAVADGIKKMHAMICDTSRTVYFVDARNQSEKLYSSQNPQNAPRVVPMTQSDYAYVKCLGVQNPHAATVAHAGSGMRVYIGERGFHPSKSLKDRSMTVYHELTHKVLGTRDYAYGVAPCKALARTPNAIKCADSWCYFAASFKYSI